MFSKNVAVGMALFVTSHLSLLSATAEEVTPIELACDGIVSLFEHEDQPRIEVSGGFLSIERERVTVSGIMNFEGLYAVREYDPAKVTFSNGYWRGVINRFTGRLVLTKPSQIQRNQLEYNFVGVCGLRERLF